MWHRALLPQQTGPRNIRANVGDILSIRITAQNLEDSKEIYVVVLPDNLNEFPAAIPGGIEVIQVPSFGPPFRAYEMREGVVLLKVKTDKRQDINILFCGKPGDTTYFTGHDITINDPQYANGPVIPPNEKELYDYFGGKAKR